MAVPADYWMKVLSLCSLSLILVTAEEWHTPRYKFLEDSDVLIRMGTFPNGTACECPPEDYSHLRSPDRHFRPHRASLKLFVAVSAHRTSSRTFAVIGESSVLAQKHFGAPVDYCEWAGTDTKQDEKKIQGKANCTTDIPDGGSGLYETVLVECIFEQNVGNDSRGGSLSVGKKQQGDDFVVYEEEPNQFNTTEQIPQYDVVVCGQPMFGNIRPGVVLDWLVYHSELLSRGGKTVHFFLYDFGLPDSDVHKVLSVFETTGHATVIVMEEHEEYNNWWHHRQTSNHDCLYRSHTAARWALFLDFEEFLIVPQGKIFSDFLKNLQIPVVSIGSFSINPKHCLANESSSDGSIIERMVWRQPTPFCKNETLDKNFCLGADGHRRLLIQPFLVSSVGAHAPHKPEEVLDWDASDSVTVPKLFFFDGALAEETCVHIEGEGSEKLKDGDGKELVRDLRLKVELLHIKEALKSQKSQANR
eukprot:TRINITY_DN2037_c0_g1_i1.p1 TRINITY_DN2037_c0_g1~~TRINITY_DN2037_c0_g1_i1.p1  ORF type:complete len:474 (+),score=90.29 TRINITY_DN2037_c0_g1_i1:69-1490(+)